MYDSILLRQANQDLSGGGGLRPAKQGPLDEEQSFLFYSILCKTLFWKLSPREHKDSRASQ